MCCNKRPKRKRTTNEEVQHQPVEAASQRNTELVQHPQPMVQKESKKGILKRFPHLFKGFPFNKKQSSQKKAIPQMVELEFHKPTKKRPSRSEFVRKSIGTTHKKEIASKEEVQKASVPLPPETTQKEEKEVFSKIIHRPDSVCKPTSYDPINTDKNSLPSNYDYVDDVTQQSIIADVTQKSDIGEFLKNPIVENVKKSLSKVPALDLEETQKSVTVELSSSSEESSSDKEPKKRDKTAKKNQNSKEKPNLKDGRRTKKDGIKRGLSGTTKKTSHRSAANPSSRSKTTKDKSKENSQVAEVHRSDRKTDKKAHLRRDQEKEHQYVDRKKSRKDEQKRTPQKNEQKKTPQKNEQKTPRKDEQKKIPRKSDQKKPSSEIIVSLDETPKPDKNTAKMSKGKPAQSKSEVQGKKVKSSKSTASILKNRTKEIWNKKL